MLPEQLPENPLHIFADWLQQARDDGHRSNPDSMALASCKPNGQPTVRIVLCKNVVVDPGYLVFYTNYQSPKSHDIENNARVAAVFHWDYSGRQARIEGIAVKSTATMSDSYFSSRDRNSQIGAWASKQSLPLESRQQLLQQFESTASEYSSADRTPIARPPHWGGYLIWAATVELWVSAEARLHDRAVWSRQLEPAGDNYQPGLWSSTRLQP